MANPFDTVTEDMFSSLNSNKYIALDNQVPTVEPATKEENKPIEEPPVVVQPKDESKSTAPKQEALPNAPKVNLTDYGDYGIKLSDDINIFKKIDPRSWIQEPAKREESVKKMTDDLYASLTTSEQLVPIVRNGKVEMVPSHSNGVLTNAGLHAYTQSVALIAEAQAAPNGGFNRNSFTKKVEPQFGSKQLTPYDPEKEKAQEEEANLKAGLSKDGMILSNDQIFNYDHVAKVIDSYAARNELDADELNVDSITPERFLQMRARIEGYKDYSGITELKQQIENSERPELDEKTSKIFEEAIGKYRAEKKMGDKLVDIYNGQPIFNYEKITDIKQFEEEFSRLKLPSAIKNLYLATFKKNFEPEAAKVLMQQFEGDQALSMAANMIPTKAVAELTGIADSIRGEGPIEEWAKGNKSAYDLLKEDPFDYNDQNLVSSSIRRVAGATSQAVFNTGMGAGALLSLASSTIAYAAGAEGLSDSLTEGGMSMVEAGSYMNKALSSNARFDGGVNKLGSVGGFDVTDEHIYSLVGQLAETYITAGAGTGVKALLGIESAVAKETLKGALKIGAKNAAEKIAEKNITNSISKAATEFTEAAASLWTNSKAVNKAGSILNTSIQGSFGSAGAALSEAYDEGISKGMSESDAYNMAIGKATANGLATFTAMTVMNSIAPGMDRALVSPEGGLSLKQAIKNTLESRASRPQIVDALKELRANDVLRPKIAKGVANAIQGQALKQGVTGYGIGVIKNATSEAVEEALDTYLSVALDAYLNLSPDAQQKLHSKGHWSEVIGAGFLGALMGGTSSGVLVRTSKENKDIAKYAKDAINEAVIRKLKGNVEGINQFLEDPESTIRLSGLGDNRIPEYAKINEVLKGKDVDKIVETIVKFGEQSLGNNILAPNLNPITPSVPKESPPVSETPSEVKDVTSAEFDSLAKDFEYKAPDGTSWVRKDGKMGNPVMIGTDANGKSVEMTTVEFAEFVNNQNKQKTSTTKETVDSTDANKSQPETNNKTPKVKSEPKLFTISNSDGFESDVTAPVESKEDLASYAYEQAHGVVAPKGKLAPKSETKTTKIKIDGKLQDVEITSYTIDGKDADLHSLTTEKGTFFFKASDIKKVINDQFNATSFATVSLSNKNDYGVSIPKVEKKESKTPEAEKETPPPNSKQEEATPDSKDKKETPSDSAPQVDEADKNGKNNEIKQLENNEVFGSEKLPKNYLAIIKKFIPVFKKIGVKIIIAKNESDMIQEMKDAGYSDDEIKSLKKSLAFADIRGGKNYIFIRADYRRESNFLKDIKHEIFHIIELNFRKTTTGKDLYSKIDIKSLTNDPELIQYMEIEYSVNYSTKSDYAKFAEMTRAFTAGKIHNNTFGNSAFAKYLKAFLKFAKKFTSRNKDLKNYLDELNAYYVNSINEFRAEYGIIASETPAFKSWIGKFIESAKNSVKPKRGKTTPVTTRSTSEEETDSIIEEVRSAISYMVVDAAEKNAPLNASSVANVIVEILNNKLISTNTGLNAAAKTKIINKVFSDWSNAETNTIAQEVIQQAVEAVNTENAMFLGAAIDEDEQVVEEVAQKAKLGGWTGVNRFIRSDKVVDTPTSQKVETTAFNDVAPYTDAFFVTELNPETQSFDDLNLSPGDVVETVTSSPDQKVTGILIYARSEEFQDGNKRKMKHHFVRVKSNDTNKMSPFGYVLKARYANEFYNAIADSNLADKIFGKDKNGKTIIASEELLIKTVFETLVAKDSDGNPVVKQGDESIKYKDLFVITTEDTSKSINPFQFKDGKIYVNTQKLVNAFGFITESMIDDDVKKSSVTMMIANIVRSALEQQLLHLAVSKTFEGNELNVFYDEMENNPIFESILNQIKSVQGIESLAGSLTDSEKALVATEAMSFIHQKAAEGATYDDQYDELVLLMLGGNNALNAAKLYGQRFRYMLGARAFTSFMSPKMQTVYERLSSSKSEMGVNRRATNMSELLSNFSEEQYRANREKMNEAINQSFLSNAFEVNELREMLADTLNISVADVLNIDFANNTVSLSPQFAEYYKAIKGEDALNAINNYFSQLSETDAVRNLADSVRSARDRMDAARINLNTASDTDLMIEQALNGGFDQLIEYLKNPAQKDSKFAFGSFIQALGGLKFDTNIQRAIDRDEKILEYYFNVLFDPIKAGTVSLAGTASGIVNYKTQLSDEYLDAVAEREAIAEAYLGDLLSNYYIPQRDESMQDFIRRAMFDLYQPTQIDVGQAIADRFTDSGYNSSQIIDAYNRIASNTSSANEIADAYALLNDLFSTRFQREQKQVNGEFVPETNEEFVSKIISLFDRIVTQNTNDKIIKRLQVMARSQGGQFTASENIVRNNISQNNKRNELINLAIKKLIDNTEVNTQSSYYNYAAAVKDYNDLVTNYAELLLNKNLNKVDDFGRNFATTYSLIDSPSASLVFNANLFGYNNETAKAAIANRVASNKALADSESDEEWKQTTAWQQAYVGRFTFNDRADNPEVVMRIESNAASLGENGYNDYVIARISGETLKLGDQEVSYSFYYTTMGFNSLETKQRIVDGYSEPEDLDAYLLKYKLSESPIKFKDFAEGQKIPTLRDINDRVIKNNQERIDKIAMRISEALFEESDISVWFASLQKLIGYNRFDGTTNIVSEINGKETFASKFAKQLIYRMFDNKKVVTANGVEGIVRQENDNAEPTLFERLESWRRIYEATHPLKYKDAPKLNKGELEATLADFKVFLEQIDSLNTDIGLARKTYSRFKSKYVKNTIMGDIRLIQQQGTDGIRANDELIKVVQDSYFDIQGMEDISWQIDYLDKRGPVGFEGVTAIQMLDAFSRIPSSAMNEYFISNPTAESYTVERNVKTKDENGNDVWTKEKVVVRNRNANVATLLQRYYQAQEMYAETGMGSPRAKDSDGKRTYALDNLVFNTLERPADRPSELDEEFNDERTPLNRGQETDSSFQSDEQSQEDIENRRRADLMEEVKRIKSWAFHSSIVLFQKFSPDSELQYMSEINSDRAKRFFYLFTESRLAIANFGEEPIVDDFKTSRSAAAQREFINLVKEQMAFLANRFKNADGSIDKAFADIAEKAMSYNHPVELMLDVMEIIAGKEREFISELQEHSGELGSMVVSQLKQNLENAAKTSYTQRATETSQPWYRDYFNEIVDLVKKENELRKRRGVKGEIKIDSKTGLPTDSDLKKQAILIKARFAEDYKKFKRDSNNVNQVFTVSANPRNEAASQSILDSMQEDMDRGELKAGTLFHARTFDLQKVTSLNMDQSLFMKSPLFSMLIQAMPNLVIYQPNENYKGKSKFVDKDVEFAQLPNGDNVLFIRNAQGVNQSKQAEILERLFISQIANERIGRGTQSELLGAIKNVASAMREQIVHAFTTTPQRISSMVAKAKEVLESNSNIDKSLVPMLIEKYQKALEMEASNTLAVFGSIAKRSDYVSDIVGHKSEDAKDFLENLLYTDVDFQGLLGFENTLSDIKLIVDMFTNPDAYRLLNAIKSPNAELSSNTLDPRYRSVLARALDVFASVEVTSAKTHEIALDTYRMIGDSEESFVPNDLINFIDPDYIISQIEASFAENFESGRKLIDSKEQKLKRAKAYVKSANPEITKRAIDRLIVASRVKGDNENSALTYDQIAKGMDVMQEFAPSPNFFYEFAATELMNALAPAQDYPKAPYSETSLFDPAYPSGKIAPANAYELIKRGFVKRPDGTKRRFNLLMSSVGNSNLSSSGNITNFFYGKAPTTKIFENRRKELFSNSLISNTEIGKGILQDAFVSASNVTTGNSNRNKPAEIDISDRPDLMKQVIKDLSLLVGADLVNEARRNVLSVEQKTNQNISDAEKRIEDIDKRIELLNKEGVEFIRQKLLERSSNSYSQSVSGIASLSENLAMIIHASKQKQNQYSGIVAKELQNGKAASAISAYRKQLIEIQKIDSDIREFLNSDITPRNISASNKAYRNLLDRRNNAVNLAMKELNSYARATATSIANHTINGGYLNYLGLDSLVDFIRDSFASKLNLSRIPVTKLTLDNLVETRATIHRSLLSQESKKSKDAFASSINSSDSVNELIGEFEQNDVVKSSLQDEIDAIIAYAGSKFDARAIAKKLRKKGVKSDEEINQFIKNLEESKLNTDSAKELFSRLKRGALSVAVKNIANKYSTLSSPEQIAKAISADLLKNPSIAKTLAKELIHDDLGTAFEIDAELDAEEGTQPESSSNIGIGNVKFEIENLENERAALKQSIGRMSSDPFVARTLFKMRKKFPFDELITDERINSQLSPFYEVNVNVRYNPNSFVDGDPKKKSVLLDMATINEAARLFIEREGESMYREMFEEIDLYGMGYDLKEDIENVIEIAKVRRGIKSASDFDYNQKLKEAFDDKIQSADEKAIQMFGVSARDMEVLRLSPAVVDFDKEGNKVLRTPRMSRWLDEGERLRKVALFIEDEFSKSVYLPTTEKLIDDPNKSYLVYNRDAAYELERQKRKTGSNWNADTVLKDMIFSAANNLTQGGIGGLMAQSNDSQVLASASNELDEEYLAAVEAGDMETAQQMVDEAAKKAGYTIRGARIGFYVDGVPLQPSGGDLNFVSGYFMAEGADRPTSNQWSVSKTVNLADLRKHDLRPEQVQQRSELVAAKASRILQIGGMGQTQLTPQEEALIQAEIDYQLAANNAYWKLGIFGKPENYDSFVDMEERIAKARGVQHVDSRIISYGRDLPSDSREPGSNNWKRALYILMRDGKIQYDAVRGIGGRTAAGEMASEFVVPRPNQIKSVEAVVKDDNGNVIPLSKRFDSSQSSILYSASSQEDLDTDKPISTQLAKASGLNPKTTIKQLINQAKQNFATFFIKNSINTEISKFAQGIGITGSVPRVRAMKQKDFDEAFESVYAFASDKNNSSDLQKSGMTLLTKEKDQYSDEEKQKIVTKAYEIAIKENQFLDPDSKSGQMIAAFQTQLTDLISMLNSDKLTEEKKSKFAVPIEAAEKSIGNLIKINELIAASTGVNPYDLNRAVLDLDLSHNYARIHSIIYGAKVLNKLIVGAHNIRSTPGLLNNPSKAVQEFASHENAIVRSRFSKNYGSYNEALNLIGLLDHGIDGNTGRNRYSAEYQALQARLGDASKDIRQDFVLGARAMLIASLRGIKIANQKDNGGDSKYGLKAWKWAYAYQGGIEADKELQKGRKEYAKTASLLSKAKNIVFKSGRKQDRERDGVEFINNLIKSEINQFVNSVNVTRMSEAEVDSWINQVIAKLESGLTSDQLAAMNKYSDALVNEFSKIADAHRIAQTFASRDNRTNLADPDPTIPDQIDEVLSETYSILPLRFGFARNPLNLNDNTFTQDAIDIDEFISIEKSAMNYKGRGFKSIDRTNPNLTGALRPIDLNPFTAPDQLADDALYRMYLAPTYKVIKKLLGDVSPNSKEQLVAKNGFFYNAVEMQNKNFGDGGDYPYIAAFIMNTINKTIRNDMPNNLDDNIVNDVLKLGNVIVVVKGLYSFIQPFLNGAIPAISKYLQIRSTNKAGFTDKDTAILMEAYKYAFMGYFNKDSVLAKFIKENSITSYKWKAQGTDTRQTQISLAKYYKQNKLKYGARYGMSKLRDLGEGSLDMVIGGPERAMVQSLYAFELFHQLKDVMGAEAPQTLAEMFAMDPTQISTLAKTKADILVTDFMGLGDKAKKAGVFNIKGGGSLAAMLVNYVTRFSNHTMTTEANRAAFVKILYHKYNKTKGFGDIDFTNDAYENIIGTTIQNSLFFLARLTVSLPILLAIISAFYDLFFDEDEPEEKMIDDILSRASRWYENIATIGKDDSKVETWLKEQTFSQYSPLTDKSIKGTATDRYAVLASRVAGDIGQEFLGNLIPSVSYGSLRGLLPVRSAEASALRQVGELAWSPIQKTKDIAETFGIIDEQKKKKSTPYQELSKKAREQDSMIKSIIASPRAPIDAVDNVANLMLNYVAPKKGKEGIDAADFLYGLYNATVGTREGRNNLPKRYQKLGGWGPVNP